MIDLFKAFATKEDFFYDGAFIAKVKYQQFQSNLGEETFKHEIVKSNRKLCVIDFVAFGAGLSSGAVLLEW